MNEELKPCPFCGSDNVILLHDCRCSNCEYLTEENEKYWEVRCEKCICSTSRCNSKEEAVKDWNRRSASQWSTDPPTKPGWYLHSFDTGNNYNYPLRYKAILLDYVNDGNDLYFLDTTAFIEVWLPLSEYIRQFDQRIQWFKIEKPE